MKNRKNHDGAEDKVAETVGPFFVLSSLHQYENQEMMKARKGQNCLSHVKPTNQETVSVITYQRNSVFLLLKK